ncbi:MAG: metallophosphoesterase, partial [Planctomycetaceae bacterium]|nr:metallophosphoesterase [Planctomycetaceae bacterium]
MSLSGMAILLLACIGNAEWWVILVNRRHAERQLHPKLRTSRLAHDLGVTLFPLFILYTAGIGDGGLLNGGPFSALPLSIRSILTVTIAGVVPLLYSMVRWHQRKEPTGLLSTQSERYHVPSHVGSSDVLGSHRPLLSRLPRNEIYHLEVTQKRLRVPARTCRGGERHTAPLRIAHLSDIHLQGCPGKAYYQFAAERLRDLRPDVFVFTGDLVDDMSLLPWADELFRSLAEAAPGYFILGNHDWNLQHPEIRQCVAEAGWTDLG